MKRSIIITAIAATAVLATGTAAAAQESGEAPAENAVVVRGDAKDHVGYGQAVSAVVVVRGDAKDHVGYGQATPVVRGDAKDHAGYGEVIETAGTSTPPLVRTPQRW